MPRLHARALVRCRPQVRGASTATQTCHSSVRASSWIFRATSFSSRRWLPASWGAASSAVRASSTSNVGTGLSGDASLARLGGKAEGSEPLSRQELRALVSTSESLEAMEPEELVAWVKRWAELDEAGLSPYVMRVPPPELCHVIRHIVSRLGDTDRQGATWSPGQCARLLFPLSRAKYYWAGQEKEDMHALAALLAPRIHGEAGKGWRKLSASELSELSAGLGWLEFRHMGGLMADIRGECLRRGLDKFKARDLGYLLSGFNDLYQEPGAELLAAIEERAGWFGYLKGRKGDTTSADVVRLFRQLCLLEDKPSAELMERMLERIDRDKGFLGEVDEKGLVGLFHACSLLKGVEGVRPMMGKVLQELEDRTGGLHRADVPVQVLMQVVGGLQYVQDVEQGREVLRRVLGRVQGEEEGASSMQPRHLGLLLRAATRFNLWRSMSRCWTVWCMTCEHRGSPTV